MKDLEKGGRAISRETKQFIDLVFQEEAQELKMSI
jgi:hypothetical protein